MALTVGPVCAGGGSEEVAVPRPEWKGKVLCFWTRRGPRARCSAGALRPPAAQAAAGARGTRVPSPPSPRAAPLAVGQARAGAGGALRTCAGQAGLLGGGATQTTNRADALLKGSRPELRRACARGTRFA